MDSGFTSFEEFKGLHEKWLLDFLAKGGFKVLLNILQTFVSEQMARPVEDTLTSSAESKCLQIAAYVTKVILLGCFSASGREGNLVTNLQRKMSSTHEELKDQEIDTNEPKKEVKEKTDLEKRDQEFHHLIEMLSRAKDPGLCMDLLDDLD
jgi:hypothetical protein